MSIALGNVEVSIIPERCGKDDHLGGGAGGGIEFAGQKAHGRELSQNGGEQRARTQPKDNTESARGSACLTERQGVDLRASTEGNRGRGRRSGAFFLPQVETERGSQERPSNKATAETRLQRLRGHLASLGASRFFFFRADRGHTHSLSRGDQPQHQNNNNKKKIIFHTQDDDGRV